jgi:amino acid transporter
MTTITFSLAARIGRTLRTPGFWIGSGLLISAIALLWIVGASESFARCVEEARRPGSTHAAPRIVLLAGYRTIFSFHCTGVFLRDNGEVIVGLGTLGLFSVTSALAFYTYQLWSATRTMADEGRVASAKTAEVMGAQQRAMESQATAAAQNLEVLAQQATAMSSIA